MMRFAYIVIMCLCCTCITPAVISESARPCCLHAVRIRLHQCEADGNTVAAFRADVERQLTQHNIDVRWLVDSPVPQDTLTIVVHQPGERLNVSKLFSEVQKLAKEADGVLHSLLLRSDVLRGLGVVLV
jgi:hypothetical protein